MLTLSSALNSLRDIDRVSKAARSLTKSNTVSARPKLTVEHFERFQLKRFFFAIEVRLHKATLLSTVPT